MFYGHCIGSYLDHSERFNYAFVLYQKGTSVIVFVSQKVALVFSPPCISLIWIKLDWTLMLKTQHFPVFFCLWRYLIWIVSLYTFVYIFILHQLMYKSLSFFIPENPKKFFIFRLMSNAKEIIEIHHDKAKHYKMWLLSLLQLLFRNQYSLSSSSCESNSRYSKHVLILKDVW